MPNSADSFQTFFEAWLVRKEHYLDELISTSRHSHESKDEDLQELISRILTHYEEYYEKMSRISQTNVFLVFSPSWFTNYEKTLLWIGGFRPGLIFKLVGCSVDDLSEEQNQRIKRLSGAIKIEERILNNELAKIQEKVAAPPLIGMLRRHGRQGHDGIIEDVEIRTMKAAYQSLLASADYLRRDTALKVVEILTPAQTVRFLAVGTQLLLRNRAVGLETEAKNRGSPSCGGFLSVLSVEEDKWIF